MRKVNRNEPEPMEIDEVDCIDIDPPGRNSPTASLEPSGELDGNSYPAKLIDRLSGPKADATPWPALLSPYLPERSHLLQNFYLFVAGAHIDGLIAENGRLTAEAYKANKRKLDAKSDLRWSTLYTHYVKCPWKKESGPKTQIDYIRQAPESTVRSWQGPTLLMKILVALEASDTIRARNERLKEYKRDGWRGLLSRGKIGEVAD